MEFKYNKSEKKNKPVCFIYKDGNLNFRHHNNQVVLVDTNGDIALLKTLDFDEEMKYATKVFYPGDELTIKF